MKIGIKKCFVLLVILSIPIVSIYLIMTNRDDSGPLIMFKDPVQQWMNMDASENSEDERKYWWTRTPNSNLLIKGNVSNEKITEAVASGRNPIFVFISNTEQCIKDTWLTADYVGDAFKCKCDVIVISYQHPCTSNTFTHITHIFAPKTSLTTGKNLGVSIARNRTDKAYLYFIIHDDDVTYVHTQFQSDIALKKPPLHAYLEFLLQYRPAFGVPAYASSSQSETFLWNYRKVVCLKNISDLVVPITRFDACTYAVQRNALNIIYPLTDYKIVRGASAHTQVKILATLAFPGQVLAYVGIRTNNNLNNRQSKYFKESLKSNQPRFSLGHAPNWLEILADAKERLPEKYREHILMKYLNATARRTNYMILKEWLCSEILPSNTPVEPFSHILEPENITCPKGILSGACSTGFFTGLSSY